MNNWTLRSRWVDYGDVTGLRASIWEKGFRTGLKLFCSVHAHEWMPLSCCKTPPCKWVKVGRSVTSDHSFCRNVACRFDSIFLNWKGWKLVQRIWTLLIESWSLKGAHPANKIWNRIISKSVPHQIYTSSHLSCKFRNAISVSQIIIHTRLSREFVVKVVVNFANCMSTQW